MGGIRTLRHQRRGRRLALAALSVLLVAGCGGDSEGQEPIRTDAELERRVEALLPRIEEFAHLAALRTPAVRRSSAATLEAYLLERLDIEFPGDTLEQLAAAYQAFGLLPEDVELRSLLVDLLLEQAIGYYDPMRDVLFVRDEAPDAMIDPVLVHELVHALQDQHVDLDSLLEATAANDARTALQAAVEGHATAAMMSWGYAQMMGGSISAEAMPEVGPEMGAALADPTEYPHLANAPAIIREPMLFVYLGGARFVQRLWRGHDGHPHPFGEWRPESTEQLLHTERLLGQRDRPVSLGLAPPADGWQVRYSRDLGELEILVYFEQHLGDRSRAAQAAAGWDGDAYALLGRDGRTALVWYTAWDSERDAEEFEDAYQAAFLARFGGAVAGQELTAPDRRAHVVRLTVSGVPMVRVVESPSGVRLERVPDVVVMGVAE